MKRISAIIAACLLAIPCFSQQDGWLEKSIKRGSGLYAANCLSCHMTDGQGIVGVYPPLAKSDYLLADKLRAARQVLHGVSGEITVNGTVYNMEMPAFALTDQQTADVVNYILNTWGNQGGHITEEDAKKARETLKE